MPSVISVTHVPIAEAEHLADLYGIKNDLAEARLLCEAALHAVEKALFADSRIVSGIIGAAMVRYMRCFGTGARFHLTEGHFDGLDPEHLNFHRLIDSIRDKFVAHPVNAFEESFVTVPTRITDGVKMPIAGGVGAGHSSRLLSIDYARDLLTLIGVIEAKLAPDVKKEEEILFARLQSLPLDEVHGWGLYSRNSFNADPNSRRKRFAPPRKV